MISSGMCGVFNEKLVDSLLKVVNHSSLVSLREVLAKKRTVISDGEGFAPNRVLFIGNTQYVTKEFIDATFPKSEVMVMGNEVGDDVIREFGKMKHFVKSKTVRKGKTEMAVEVYCKDSNMFFLDKIRDTEGVEDATLIQYNGEYHG
jgi:hypothetical protein